MDDIFDQMLSTSPWGDGVGINRASWDAMATSSAGSLMTDSSAELQALNKASQMQPPVGGLASQGILTRTMQDGNVPLSSASIFDTGQGRGRMPGAQHLQSVAAPNWYMGGVPSMPGLNAGKPDAFSLQGEVISQETHHGKRPRDEDGISLDGLSRNLAHVAAVSQGSGKPIQSFGDHATTLGPQDLTGAALKPRVRARRGQATDPHSIAERNRRERIAERMKALQELVPDSNKTDKASMLDEIIGYVKFLQMQVKCLSMCRLGGTAGGAAGALLADLPAEGASNFMAANLGQGIMGGGPGTSQEGMAFAERQVARLMDEDMSAAMQYLQSKGLCLMPISLATAISSTGARQPPAKLGAEGAADMKQAMEMQAAAMAAAAAAAVAAGGGSGTGSSSRSVPFGCNQKSQESGSSKVHANVARALMQDLQRDHDKTKADQAVLPPPPFPKHK